MRISTCYFFTFVSALTLLLSACVNREKSDNWQEIFDGENLSGWLVKINHHDLSDNYANTFRVRDGVMQIRYDQYDSFNERFGHIFYHQPFSNFHLKYEYKFTGKFLSSAPSYANRNSGVMFYSQAPDTIKRDQNWPISVEMQLLAEREPGKSRPTGNMCSPGTDIRYNGKIYEEHCLNSDSNTYPLDEWIKAELIVIDNHVTQIINGDTVLEYDVAFAKKDDLVEGEDPAIWKQLSPLESGYIGFQSEGQPIDFRHIVIKELN